MESGEATGQESRGVAPGLGGEPLCLLHAQDRTELLRSGTQNRSYVGWNSNQPAIHSSVPAPAPWTLASGVFQVPIGLRLFQSSLFKAHWGISFAKVGTPFHMMDDAFPPK